jgi:phosphate transport system ATP-binding protein
MMRTQIAVDHFNVWYGQSHVLKDISTDIPARCITAIIGPSGSGKTTLLRSINRLLEEAEGVRTEGRILLDGENIYAPGMDVTEIRTRIGLLAPKPYPLPMSIYDNIAYGPRIHGFSSKPARHHGRELDRIVETNLAAAGLWDEVKDRLHTPASQLSTGQQQRLCLARALAVDPEVLLCDEPTSALDPISAQRIEEQLKQLKERMTIVVVTHMLRQTRRLADHVLLLWMGECIEAGTSEQVFQDPRNSRTQAYINGCIG